MSHRILVVGAGQLGSRHLQGLARSSLDLRIDVVDVSPDALALARSRFAEVAADPAAASYHLELPAGRAYDAAIVATPSGPRAAAVEKLLAACEVGGLILEKVLFPRLEDYDRIGALLEAKRVPAWVNCPRRLYPLYRELFPDLAGPVRIVLQGGMWGLGCNSIHIVDLASWLCGEEEFHWDASGLDPLLHPSAREGYLEFSGALNIASAGGSSVHLYAKAGSTAPTTMHILGEKVTLIINEGLGHAVISRKAQDCPPQHLTFRLPFQSEMSFQPVEAILAAGTCGLPGYAASAKLHVGMIRAFLGHLRRLGHDDGICPVT